MNPIVVIANSYPGTTAELVAWMDELVVTPNSAKYTYDSLAAAVGVDVVSTVDEVLKGIPELSWARLALGGSGIDLSTPKALEVLGTIKQKVPEVEKAVDAVLACVAPTAPRWQSLGLGSLPTEDEITAARAPAPTEFPRRSVLLSLNVQPAADGRRVMVSCRAVPAVVTDSGVVQDSDPAHAKVFGSHDADTLTDPAQQALVTALLAAVDTYTGGA